jgi:hypothetical protein
MEIDVVRHIFSLADRASGCKLERYEVVVIPSSCVVSVGEKYHAEIILTLRTDFHPEMIVKGNKIEVVDDEGYYSVIEKSAGVKKWSGVIRIKQSDGTTKEYKIPEQTYTVVPNNKNK